ncbi:conserved Plasmodium protein, unknown function [Plasmodium knowlesi strain H]|uniref:Uncharacterized protein n=3 Tax=Plasmodium knowlesi TaxID=5850 RepID=A0A5K1TX48_PLAKH|nr:conserved Plasmodium protein, unknown function [Plasmodium knowlesi strain H]OTN65038.1 Uncharacterized protein PKNOH_S120124800 [Plasmodium knowlesi]CAA9988114.1 conserved Plasmodium protein, unknown function [Plasmodium knowlesi strain H]SBO19988.1 conserved Plasmodium protein, unknown function [Plasmodium knowlesi strain H]SBO29117.1 conserved Plasmodium protein, unknown function [Plasmodium knowlesi strain H]VVS77588.1 conserved Plasmodium protein, unknown function [Plasmodium knowlesi |eukprot:XP_002259088.1 hypothetical protein, conserved in Plasmodium species [Plasmodium knowlesi strain H]
MGNSSSSQNEHRRRRLILLSDEHTQNCGEKNDAKIQGGINLEDTVNNTQEQTIVQMAPTGGEQQYKELRSEILNDLIKEREKYMHSQIDQFYATDSGDYNEFISTQMSKNKCIPDEQRIYKCLKDMNASTSGFVNSYSRCCRYLQRYENCVHKISV